MDSLQMWIWMWTQMDGAALPVNNAIVAVLFPGANKSDEPRFVEPIQNVTIPAGRDIKLSCVVEDLGTFKVAWIAFDKSAILTVEGQVITRNPRINVTHDGHRTWTLHIANVVATDAGTYMCQVNTIVAKSQYGYLSVVVPPNIVDEESSGDITVQENENVTLVCRATGTPKPQVKWKREDHQKICINKSHEVLEHIGEDLHLSRIQRTDMAAYLCIAQNGVSPIVSKRIQVKVNFPPMMSIPHQLVGAPLGYSITLECAIEAHPSSLTYWTNDEGQIIHQSIKHKISETQSGELTYQTNMKLTIRKLQKEDFGSYKCVAKNSRGETEGLIKLYETEPPTEPPTSSSSILEKVFKENSFKNTNSLREKGSMSKGVFSPGGGGGSGGGGGIRRGGVGGVGGSAKDDQLLDHQEREDRKRIEDRRQFEEEIRRRENVKSEREENIFDLFNAATGVHASSPLLLVTVLHLLS
ncbi:lachesin-like [Oratosquilla oratoria]|uniref:lachesin-like n=1 Tax=Oratosquilla oratoria TaxID=337810 RepID=UPI003F761E33